jgi:phytoene dehydrogenase-like protein
LKENPQKLGYLGENLWIYSDYDHDRLYSSRNEILEGRVGACYVSSPSLKNPRAAGHTLELISFVDPEPFSQWENLPWKNRGSDYMQVKNRISESMISVLERQIPGITGLIDYKELSTPLSTHFFTGHRGGSIYGLPGIPQKFKNSWLKINAPLKNLYLTGSDVAVHGIVGAMMGGVFTTGILTGMPAGLMKIFRTAMQYSKELGIRD